VQQICGPDISGYGGANPPPLLKELTTFIKEDTLAIFEEVEGAGEGVGELLRPFTPEEEGRSPSPSPSPKARAKAAIKNSTVHNELHWGGRSPPFLIPPPSSPSTLARGRGSLGVPRRANPCGKGRVRDTPPPSPTIISEASVGGRRYGAGEGL